MNKRHLLFLLSAFTFLSSANSQIEEDQHDLSQVEEQIIPDENSTQEIPSLPEEIYFEDERGLDLPDETYDTFEESSSQ